jgi:AcrR family transcriptional regulator
LLTVYSVSLLLHRGVHLKNEILNASVQTVVEDGLSGWTVDAVARRAGCAKGLVPYHHGSKQALLEATAHALADRHAAVRHRALGSRRAQGTAALDALWEALRAEVDSGFFAAWLAVLSDPALQPSVRASSAERPAELIQLAARALALAPEDLPLPQTVDTVLDGCQLRLLQGFVREQTVRDAYERLWLSLLPGG